MSIEYQTTGKLPVQDVLVVGGGVAGLSAAIALGERGANVTVLERSDGDARVGAAIGIGGRPVWALEELGILEPIKKVALVRPIDGPDEAMVHKLLDADGKVLAVVPLTYSEDWTLPASVRLYRPLFAEIMRDAAQAAGAEVLFGHTYTSLEVHPDRVEVELTTGQRRSFDLLVGADGINSELRARFFPEAGRPIYTGSMSLRVMFDDAPEDWLTGLHVAPNAGGTGLDARGRRIATTLLPGRVFCLAIPEHMERRRIEQDEARSMVKAILADFTTSKTFEEVSERITDDTEVLVAPFEWIFIPPPWSRGRIVLIGDAIHATAPSIGAAGGMAVEDAVVLAQELERHEDLDFALSAYARRRHDRAKLVVETSAKLMEMQQQRLPQTAQEELRQVALQELNEPY
jgi:2-polyprenyl-6-methoxyphenol hydroxylase-like FAD-dependent oxidoreductase